jgi:hypothetical protein
MDGGSCDGGGSHGGDCGVSHSADGDPSFVDTAIYYTDSGPVTVSKEKPENKPMTWGEFFIGLLIIGFGVFCAIMAMGSK